MIINCINCNKKFEVNSDLIPENGRSIQCGSCNHIWFYSKKTVLKTINIEDNLIQDTTNIEQDIKSIDKETIKKNDAKKTSDKNINALIKYQNKPKLTFGKFLSYIFVSIISFLALILILDTFKSPLEVLFPGLELLLFNLFETFDDIGLFIKDLT